MAYKFRLLSLLIALTACLVVLGTAAAFGFPPESLRIDRAAQTSGEWSPAENLSRSGATSDPQVVVDSIGRHHVLWGDSIDGFVYVSGGNGNWSDPAVVELPFFTRRYFPEMQSQTPTPRFNPLLVADRSGNIHAFWVDTVSDSRGVLSHSSVPAGAFRQFDSWSPRQQLDIGGIVPAVTADGNGVHLAYIRTLETDNRPAGVYYRRLPFTGGQWSDARPLYTSRYLRSLTDANGNVSIASSGNGQLFVAWDDTAQEQVYVSRSNDTGASWEAPLEIDRRAVDDPPDAIGPRQVLVGANGDSPVVVWQAGHQTSQTCTQYYRAIPSGGTEWSMPQFISNLNTCLDSVSFHSDGGILYLLGATGMGGATGGSPDLQAYLLAWDGARWSDTQPQGDLSAFVNPVTNQPIDLQCLSGATNDGRMGVVGCDAGVGADIWFSSRELGDTSTWFPPPAVWAGPAEISSSNGAIADMEIVADGVGRVHAMWVDSSSGQIFHAQRDGSGWSAGAPAINADGSTFEQFDLASDGVRLFVTYEDATGLHFSQAAADQPREWSIPVNLIDAESSPTNPALLSTRAGELLLVYSIALNEPRGAYLIRSADMGATWSEPIMIFSGAAAGWDAVGRASLAETADGILHATWTQRSLPPDDEAVGVAYSRSEDSGYNWSPIDEFAGQQAPWSDLIAFGQGSVHRMWTEEFENQEIVWHAWSVDSGQSWFEKSQVGTFQSDVEPSVAIDPAGRLQLLTLEDGRLSNWSFDGSGWTLNEGMNLSRVGGRVLRSVVDTAGKLVAVLGLDVRAGEGETLSGEVLAMERPLDVPAEALPTPPPPPPTQAPAPTAEPTATPEPTPTVVLPTAMPPNPLSEIPGTGSRTGQLALAIIPAAMVIVVVVVVAIRAMQRRGGASG